MRFTSVLFTLCLTILLTSSLLSQQHKIISSDADHFIVEFNFDGVYQLHDTIINGNAFHYFSGDFYSFREFGEPWLPSHFFNLAIPFNSNPKLSIVKQQSAVLKNVFFLPYPELDDDGKLSVEKFDEAVYSKNEYYPTSHAQLMPNAIFRYSKILPVEISPYRFNPVSREAVFLKSITIRIDFNNSGYEGIQSVFSDNFTSEFLSNSVLNNNVAKQLMAKENMKSNSPTSNYWYDPQKNWYKIYLKEKGLYRITFEQLSAAGVNLGTGIPSYKLELYNEGNAVPIEVKDGGDATFQPGDFINFVGVPPSPSPYSYLNIYNNSNLYWLSINGDTTSLRFEYKDAYPSNYDRTINTVLRVDHYEKDSLYERLGYAGDGNRDYWFWDKVTGQDSISTHKFISRFVRLYEFNENNPVVNLRVGMHGMTKYDCFYDHIAKVFINDKLVGDTRWNGQEEKIFSSNFYVSPDSFQIFFDGNYISVSVNGLTCNPWSKYDEIRVNWYEFEYWTFNRVNVNHYFFTSPPNRDGLNRYWTWNWQTDSMRVFVPSKNQIFINTFFLNDSDRTITFVDSTIGRVDYYCVADNYFLSVDSIRTDVPSNLRSTANGADYIIVTHSAFNNIAQRLASIRSANYPDSGITTPRIFIADIQDIYDEFSYGLLSPTAIKDFVKHAFENYQTPAPVYVALVGDMSYDYREIIPTNKKNYIPSLPYHSYTYGQAASDNGFVCVVGTDILPDLAIGRISIEDETQGNNFLDKISSYPSNPDKLWRESILLMASGLNNDDENQFGFNDASLRLKSDFISNNGFNAYLVFRYPNKPEHYPYLGSTAEIRKYFDKGVSIANYYGHGGGYQWDLTFLLDDIYLLRNEGKFPLVMSVTCYTAHFDNQYVFGEQFNNVAGKGSIGFFGSSGLTHWEIGKFVNNLTFDQIYNKKNYITGKAFLNAKGLTPPFGFYANQISLLTYLGDPALELAFPKTVDFAITGSDISVQPETPIVDDTVAVKVKLYNYGILISDSVSVELFFSSSDTSGTIGKVRIPVFGNADSVIFSWIPTLGGLYSLHAKINLVDSLYESDYSDNTGTTNVPVYNLSEPSIIEPIDGYKTGESQVKFLITDIGQYIQRELQYFIEIDTSLNFTNPIFTSGALFAQDGILNWITPPLNINHYFWRARIFDGDNMGKWSKIRTFSISTEDFAGFTISGNQLLLFESSNMNYNGVNQSLSLNTALLPPKPSVETKLEEILLDSTAIFDSVGRSCLTTDGKYFYIGHLWFYVFNYNLSGKSFIYKFGTGFQGTVKGQYYGTVPNFYDQIRNQIVYHSDGYIYVPFKDAHHIIRVHPDFGTIDTVSVNAGLLDWATGDTTKNAYYLASDSMYIYNIAVYDTTGAPRYTIRKFSTSTTPPYDWQLVNEYFYPNLLSYQGFASFFVFEDRFYPYENYNSGFMRRIRLSDGTYEQEWQTNYSLNPSEVMRYFAWTYDWTNDLIYSTVYMLGKNLPRAIGVFKLKYLDSKGDVETSNIGPAKEWKNLQYDITSGSASGSYNVKLFGFNQESKQWDTLNQSVPSPFDLSSIDADKHTNMKLKFSFLDTSFTSVNPIQFSNISVGYDELPEIVLTKNDFKFDQDSLLQGMPTTFRLTARNLGKGEVSSAMLRFYFDGSDSVFYSAPISLLPKDSSKVSYTFDTSPFIFDHSVKAIVDFPKREYFTFNNINSRSFFVARDSVNPGFNITFDGKEIINGDIIAKKPHIQITLEDNSPMPLDTSFFTLIYDNVPMNFSRSDLQKSYSPYPNSKFVIDWRPTLTKGRHTLDVLAKDASGNFFDTTYHRSIFYVYDENDIALIYNYPNPFSDNTHFTFELRGSQKPDELSIKIYTVAGRLIKDLKIPYTDYNIGFNKILWDGRDQDGDDIANGLYIYKVISKFPDKTKSTNHKLVRMR